MKITLAGPFDTASFMMRTGVDLTGLPPGMGGSPVVNLAVEFYRRGMQFSIVTLDGSIDRSVKAVRDGVTLIYCPFRGPPRYRARVRALDLFRMEIDALKAALDEISPDMVHAHWTYEYAEAAVRSGLPHVVTMHDVGWEMLRIYRDGYRLARLLMNLRVMPRIKHLGVVAPFMGRLARMHGHFGPIDLLPNGIETPASPRDPAAILSGSPLKIVTIGDPTRGKNVRASVEAHRILRQRLPQTELHLFGPGLDADFCAGEPQVTGHGHVPHARLMRFLEEEAALLVHPSRHESFGLIILEAKARGVPVVAGHRSGGVPFACGHDAGCRLVDIRCPSAIADAAGELLSSPPAYARAAARARMDAQDRFSISAIAERHVALYEAAINAQSRREA